MSSVRENIRKVLNHSMSSQWSDIEVAERVLEMGDEYDWREAALELLPDAVWAIRRHEAKKIEREAVARAKERERKISEQLDEEARAEGYEDAAEKKAARFAELEERLAAKRKDHWRHLHEITQEMLRPYEAAKEFTDAFLASEFAIGDGRRVTWGEATADDHAARIEMMKRNIEGMEDDVMLHMQVVEVLKSIGVRNLNEAKTKSLAAA